MSSKRVRLAKIALLLKLKRIEEEKEFEKQNLKKTKEKKEVQRQKIKERKEVQKHIKNIEEEKEVQKQHMENIEEEIEVQTQHLIKRIEEEKEVQTQEIKERPTKRKCWVKPSLITRCDADVDIEAHLLKDLLWEDDDKDINNFCRLSKVKFEQLFNMVQSKITKKDTHMRAAISARTKLAVTLRYLATGDSLRSLEIATRVSSSTISIFVPRVLRAIYDVLKDLYFKMPDTEKEWKNIAKDFVNIWQFPHTLGALDGKHICIKAPANSEPQFYNLKGFFSIVLFAAVDAHCRFTFVNVDSSGKASDSTIYQDSDLYNSLQNGDLNIPKCKKLVNGRGSKIPYFFIGDDKFALDKHLMKPYNSTFKLNTPQEIFNYRLSRARIVVECAFGRLSKRFGIFNRPIAVQTSTVDLIVMTACVLHNYLTKSKAPPISPDFEIEIFPSTFASIGHQENEAYEYDSSTRDEISNYLITDGNVDFQWEKLNMEHD